MDDAKNALLAMFVRETDDRRQLRAMWALYVIGGTDEVWLRDRLTAPSEHVRAWAVRLLADQGSPSRETVAALERAAESDSSGLVRLYLAAALQRLPLEQRWDIANVLAKHLEDGSDRQLPLMIWYGIEEAVPEAPDRAVELCAGEIIPVVRRNVARRLTANMDENSRPIDELVALLRSREQVEFRLDILRGMFDALRGWRKAPMPSKWSEAATALSASTNEEMKELTRQLGIVFGDGRGAAELRAIATDTTAEIYSRRSAVRSLAQERAADTLPLLKLLALDIGVSGEAVRGLAAYDDPAIPELILSRFQYLDPQGKLNAVDTLTSRPSYAKALLAAVAAGAVPKNFISASHARQISGFQDEELSAALKTEWGTLRATDQERRSKIEQLTTSLTLERLSHADASKGRALFNQACSVCHKLYGEGKQIGPDLTGSNRSNVTYLLENIVDPSATLSNDFRVSTVLTTDGRMLTGVVLHKDNRTMTLTNQTEEFVISLDEVDEIEQTEMSLMPDGLLTPYSEEQIADLISYLMSRSQVPLPE
jgi:putative heme-binding domain-containing protein